MRKLILSFLSLIIFFSCSNNHSVEKPENKQNIYVSISPYHGLIKKIVGDSINVNLLISPNQSPHHYEPTLKQIHSISNSTVWFCIGETFEKRLKELLEIKTKSLDIIDINQDMDLLYLDEKKDIEKKDIHLWMSPKRIKPQLEKITKILIEKFPENQNLYNNNLQKLLKKLSELDKNLQISLQSSKDQTILISHPSLSYFCEDYNLKQLTTEKNGHQPNGKYLTEVLKKVKENDVKTALVQPQHDNQAVQLIAKEAKISLQLIDPFNPDYFANIKKIAKIIENNQNMQAKQ